MHQNMSEISSRRFIILLRLLIISWTYLGFLRIYIFPSLANYLYFIPYAILVAIVFYSLTRLWHFMIKPSIFILLNILFLLFQIFHVFQSNMSLVTAIYGYCLYMLPVNLLSLPRILAKVYSKVSFTNLFLFAAFPNLIMALLQTLVPNSGYARGIINDNNATTVGGYSRAYGTFSSPAGFAIFLSILTACILIALKYKSFKLRSVLYVHLVLLYIISGSRTVFLSLSIILIAQLISSAFMTSGKKFAGLLKLSLGLLSIYLVATQFFTIGPLNAFLTRVSVSRVEENLPMRIFENLFGFTGYLYQPFFGSGLGTYAVGTVGYTNRSQWIELDLVRNIFELGTILGLLWIAFRFSLCISLLLVFLHRRDLHSLILFSSIAPYLLFGVISGQSSISIGCWLVIAFAISWSIAKQNND